MAKKGVLIDRSKKYKTESGVKIIRFEHNTDSTANIYPIKAILKFSDGSEDFCTYTLDGFADSDKDPSILNLIEDKEETSNGN